MIELSSRSRSILILVGTFILGGFLGGVLTGTVMKQRHEKRDGMRHEQGFIEHIERIVEPHDEDQRQKVHAIIEETANRNREIFRDAHDQLRDAFSEMLENLDGVLDDQQMARLKEEHRKIVKGGPPPIGPDGRRGGPGRRGKGGPLREGRPGPDASPDDAALPPGDTIP